MLTLLVLAHGHTGDGRLVVEENDIQGLPLEVLQGLLIEDYLEGSSIIKLRLRTLAALRVVVIEGIELVEEERLDVACVSVAQFETISSNDGNCDHFFIGLAANTAAPYIILYRINLLLLSDVSQGLLDRLAQSHLDRDLAERLQSLDGSRDTCAVF